MLGIAAVTLVGAGSAGLAEVGLRVRHRIAPPAAAAESAVAGTGARWQSEQVRAADGVTLDAWLFTPPNPNGGAVLVLHGNGERRDAMVPHIRYLLAAGYSVLAPDSRGHGGSGGNIETYGLRETADLGRWLDLLGSLHGNVRFYGLGESLGAAILIQSLATEKRLSAVVADSPFATFEEAAFNRLSRRLFLPRAIGWTPVQLGFVYSRAVYGLDLRAAAPIEAIRASHTPVLLIHGLKDVATPAYHSRELHQANPGMTELWEVPEAGHTRSRTVQPEEYRRRVVSWFGGHV
jgi:dipeptidyl aminopeptidase/acylaminoacyl peptidase